MVRRNTVGCVTTQGVYCCVTYFLLVPDWGEITSLVGQFRYNVCAYNNPMGLLPISLPQPTPKSQTRVISMFHCSNSKRGDSDSIYGSGSNNAHNNGIVKEEDIKYEVCRSRHSVSFSCCKVNAPTLIQFIELKAYLSTAQLSLKTSSFLVYLPLYLITLNHNRSNLLVYYK